MRQSSRCCFWESLGCLPRNLPLARAMAIPFTRAHPNEIGLELGKGGQDVEKHLAHRVAGVMDVSAQGELHPLGLQLIGNVPGIGNRPRQAVQLWHHQGVTPYAPRPWPDPGRAGPG